MTLKDIATEVGVSISTVSRVVNSRNIHAASPEIQQAIWECVRKTGYKPNSKLRKSNANSAEFENIQNPLKVIACIFARDNISITDNSFFTGIVKSFERTALSLNYTTQNYFTAIEVNQRNIELLSGQHLDGGGFSGSVHSQKRKDFPLFYGKVQIIHRHHILVSFCQAFYLDGIHLQPSFSNCLFIP